MSYVAQINFTHNVFLFFFCLIVRLTVAVCVRMCVLYVLSGTSYEMRNRNDLIARFTFFFSLFLLTSLNCVCVTKYTFDEVVHDMALPMGVRIVRPLIAERTVSGHENPMHIFFFDTMK